MKIAYVLKRIFLLIVLAALPGCGSGGDVAAGADSAEGSDGSAAASALGNTPPAPRFAYVTNADGVWAYAINDQTGALSEVAGSPFAAEAGPSSISVDSAGRFAYVTNGGLTDVWADSVSAFTINATTGALTRVGAATVAGSHPRSVTVDPSGRFAYVANGGDLNSSSHNVSAYTIDAATGALSAVAGSPYAAGSNPSCITVDPSGKFAYVSNQASQDVFAYSINVATGALTRIGVSGAAAGIAYAVAVDPSGKFAYVANGNSDNVSAYTIDATTGALSEVAGSPFAAGSIALSVSVDPSGKFAYVANFNSNDISAYTIDAATGALSVIGAAVAARSGTRYVAVDASGKFAYVTNNDGVSAYAIDAATGALTEVAGSPFATGKPAGTIATTGRFR